MNGLGAIVELLEHHLGRPNRWAGQHQNINQKLDWIIEHMATKAQLDTALQQIKQDVADAAQRAQQAMADLQAKIDAGQDFQAELDQVNAIHADLSKIAAAPTPSGGTTTDQGSGSAPASSGAESPHPLNPDTGVREPAAPDNPPATTAANDPFAHAVPTGAVVAPENQTPPLEHQVQPDDKTAAPAENKDTTSVVTVPGGGTGPEVTAAPAATTDQPAQP